jgi:hypothetical protein
MDGLRRFTGDVLGDLGIDDERSQWLRDTLREFLARNRSYVATADAMYRRRPGDGKLWPEFQRSRCRVHRADGVGGLPLDGAGGPVRGQTKQRQRVMLRAQTGC